MGPTDSRVEEENVRKIWVAYLWRSCYIQIIIQLSPEGEVNSGGYIPRREASRYISTALHRPWGG